MSNHCCLLRIERSLAVLPLFQTWTRVFEALQHITLAQLLAEGRVYGGGLHKVEPKELAQIPARTILDRLDADIVINRQACLFG
jgi:hypothetical protein